MLVHGKQTYLYFNIVSLHIVFYFLAASYHDKKPRPIALKYDPLPLGQVSLNSHAIIESSH